MIYYKHHISKDTSHIVCAEVSSDYIPHSLIDDSHHNYTDALHYQCIYVFPDHFPYWMIYYTHYTNVDTHDYLFVRVSTVCSDVQNVSYTSYAKMKTPHHMRLHVHSDHTVRDTEIYYNHFIQREQHVSTEDNNGTYNIYFKKQVCSLLKPI